MNLLEQAVELNGTQGKLAVKINEYHRMHGQPQKRVSQQNISHWIKAGITPEVHVIPIAWACGWKITPHELNSYSYPHPEDGLPAERRSVSRIQSCTASQTV